MSDLLDLLEDWSDAVAWVPIYKVFGDLASMVRPDLCRDCGARAGYNQGGAGGPGTPDHSSYMVCDECAEIDGCRIVAHEPVIEHDEHLGMKRAARCSCGWWIGPVFWGDRRDRHEYTVDELRDIVADHIRPRHSSRWGCYPHEIVDCAKLHQAQEKRRARFRAKHPEVVSSIA